MNDLIPIATVELVRFLSAKLPDLSPDWWRKHVVDRLTFQQQRIVEERNHDKLQQLDLAALLRVLDHNWFELSNTLKLPREGRNWVKELQTVRNRWAHISSEDVSSSDVYRDADTLGRLLTIIEAQQSSLDAVEAAKKFALASMSRNENDQANKVTELETPVSGQRSIIGTFQAGNGPDWPTYVALLKERDDEWKRVRVGGTQIRVFGPQPSWQDTIARGQFIFDEDNWDTLDDDQCAMIAPTHEFLTGNALLGSIGRRSTDVRDFLFNPERAKTAIMCSTTYAGSEMPRAGRLWQTRATSCQNCALFAAWAKRLQPGYSAWRAQTVLSS